jgi:hypothetical protein
MIFTVKQGKHYSDGLIYKALNLFTFTGKLSRTVMFDESCEYSLPTEDQRDVNKLFGYSVGFDHHQNSARFGWHWYRGSIYVSAYLYRDGERIDLPLTKLNLKTWYQFSLEAQAESDCFVIRDHESTLVIANIERRAKFRGGIQLWPYFGGNNSAPHDVQIRMESLPLNV